MDKGESMSRKTILYFGSPSCTQCRAIQRSLSFFNNIKPCEDYEKWNVTGLPTLIVVGEDNQEIKRHTGFMTAKQIAVWL